MKDIFKRTALVLALGAITASLAPTQAVGQTKTTYKEKDLGLLPAQQVQPDLTGLWYHISLDKEIVVKNPTMITMSHALVLIKNGTEIRSAVRCIPAPSLVFTCKTMK